MNAYIFLIHSALVLSTLFVVLRLGKEALIAFVVCCGLFANFFVHKEIVLFGYEVTASDVYTIGAMFGCFVLQQYWGAQLVKRTVWISFLLLFFGMGASYFHLLYTPSPHDSSHMHYAACLQTAPRLCFASCVSYLLTQSVEIWLFRLFIQLRRIPLPIRACVIGAIVQFMDTVLFSYLGLYGTVHALWDIIIISYTIKLGITCLYAFFLPLLKNEPIEPLA